MKIIFLNTWNGKMKDGITGFIKSHLADTDVFCFQEVYPDMRRFCHELLSDYNETHAYKDLGNEDDFPQGTYVRKNIKEVSEIIFEGQMDVGLGIGTEINYDGQTIRICNFHGRAFPGDKLDTPHRLKQSQGLINFYKNRGGLKIIGGDFNMLPETKSMRMFGENGYRDLIHEFGIKATRNRLAWEKFPDNPQYFSDFVFLSRDVKLKSFSVPDVEISDHLPLILEIGI